MEKLIKKNYYEAMISAIETGETPISPEDLVDFCKNEIELLDKKAAKAKERNAEKAEKPDELLEVVASVLTTEFKTIGEIAAAVEAKDSNATTQKVTSRLSKLVDMGEATKKQITIPASGEVKARKLQAYAKVSE